MDYKDINEYLIYEDGQVFSKKYKKIIKQRKTCLGNEWRYV